MPVFLDSSNIFSHFALSAKPVDQPTKSEAEPSKKPMPKTVDFDDDEDEDDILGSLGLEKSTKSEYH